VQGILPENLYKAMGYRKYVFIAGRNGKRDVLRAGGNGYEAKTE